MRLATINTINAINAVRDLAQRAVVVAVVAGAACGILSAISPAGRAQAATEPRAPWLANPTSLSQQFASAGALPAAPVQAPGASAIPAAGSTANGCPITPVQASLEQFLLNRLNAHRQGGGLAPLRINETLSLASREHACEMFHRQIMQHPSADGSSPYDRMHRVGVTFAVAGENIGYAEEGDPQGGLAMIDNEFMAEPLAAYDHHWAIMNPAFTQVGLGVIYANNQVWFTEDFVG